jgi:hypothetical protein
VLVSLPKTWSFSPGRFFAFQLPRTMAGVTYKYSGGVARYRQVPGRVGRASEIRYRSYAILSPVARPMVPLPSLTLGLLVSALLAAQEAVFDERTRRVQRGGARCGHFYQSDIWIWHAAEEFQNGGSHDAFATTAPRPSRQCLIQRLVADAKVRGQV